MSGAPLRSSRSTFGELGCNVTVRRSLRGSRRTWCTARCCSRSRGSRRAFRCASPRTPRGAVARGAASAGFCHGGRAGGLRRGPACSGASGVLHGVGALRAPSCQRRPRTSWPRSQVDASALRAFLAAGSRWPSSRTLPRTRPLGDPRVDRLEKGPPRCVATPRGPRRTYAARGRSSCRSGSCSRQMSLAVRAYADALAAPPRPASRASARWPAARSSSSRPWSPTRPAVSRVSELWTMRARPTRPTPSGAVGAAGRRAGARRWPSSRATKQRAMLAHELAHVERRDAAVAGAHARRCSSCLPLTAA
jgi:hypothetical protein